MPYELYNYDPSLPPIMMENVPLGYGGGPVVENNYVIGSAIYTDSNFRRAEPSSATFVPDPNWKKYPKELYPAIFGMLPVDRGITTYSADDAHYLFYQPNSSKSREYSRMLRSVLENKKTKKTKDVLSPSEVKELIKTKTKLLKDYEEQLRKIKEEVSRAKTVYQRQTRSERGQEQSMQTKVYEQNYNQIEDTIKVFQKNISSLKDEIKQLKKMA